MPPTRVLIADDHRLFRNGLVSMFATRSDVLVVGEAADGAEALEKTADLKPDLVLLDLLMPVMGGLEALRRIRNEHPGTRVIMLTASENDADLLNALKGGAQGYLLKTCEPDDLFRAVRSAMAGQTTVSGVVAASALRGMSEQGTRQTGNESLTDREMDVLRLVASGATNKEIAARLNITVNTVKNHLRDILDKLHLQNRTQVAAYALREGLVAHQRPDNQT
jgi:two-component system, NarL family, nitrate/nitrite response regulator NarL